MKQRLIDANDLINNVMAKTFGLRICDIDDAQTILTIPDNPTNGDIVKAIFNIPDSEIDEGLSTTYIYTKTRVLKGGSQDHLREQITFNKDWWNAPYKKE